MKIGFIAGAFDLFHPGHLYVLFEAKKLCDYLVVGLHVDPSIERDNKNHPVQTAYERYKQLEACEYINHIIPYETETDLLNILNIENITVRFLGSEYEAPDVKITGREIVPIEFIPRHHSWSSTELRDRLK